MKYIVVTLSLLVLFLSYKNYEQYKAKDLFKKVKWCVTDNSLPKMIDHILYLQRNLEIEEKYKITKDEYAIITDILKCYQEDLVQKYFNDHLSNYKYVEEVSFVISLEEYLSRHQCDKVFNDNEMYTTKNLNTYGTWGTTSFSATYVLTDYAVSYNKLLYLVQLYFLKLHNITDRNKFGVIQAQTTKEAIDKRELDVNNF